MLSWGCMCLWCIPLYSWYCGLISKMLLLLMRHTVIAFPRRSGIMAWPMRFDNLSYHGQSMVTRLETKMWHVDAHLYEGFRFVNSYCSYIIVRCTEIFKPTIDWIVNVHGERSNFKLTYPGEGEVEPLWGVCRGGGVYSLFSVQRVWIFSGMTHYLIKYINIRIK